MTFFCSMFWTGTSALCSALTEGITALLLGSRGGESCCSKGANLALPATSGNVSSPYRPVIKCHPNCMLPPLPLHLPLPTAPRQPSHMGAARELVPWPCCLSGTGAASSPPHGWELTRCVHLGCGFLQMFTQGRPLLCTRSQ